jgi:hypothetical protein
MRKQPGMGGGPPRATFWRWKALGDWPTRFEKRELNEPTLLKPTSMHTSVTVRLAARRRSLARSTRRRDRYAIGVSP